MQSFNLEKDNVIAAMKAWNYLTSVLEDENIVTESEFSDVEQFESFYTEIMKRLHEEGEAD